MKSLRARRRAGISEMIGVILMVAITLVAGAIIFGFVNNQAGASEGQYDQSVANNVNYLREHFEVVNSNYVIGACPNGPAGSGCFSISFYNNGGTGLTISEVTITNSSTDGVNGAAVGWFKVVAYDNGTVKAYNKSVSGSGTTITTCTAPSGSTTLTTAAIAENSAPATYTVTVPSCSSNAVSPPSTNPASYSIQAVGLYGNVVQTQVEA